MFKTYEYVSKAYKARIATCLSLQPINYVLLSLYVVYCSSFY